MKKVVLEGPPKSGKSCLREALKQSIRQIPGAPYPHIITGCPDGEGAWFQETVGRNPEEAREMKEDYKEDLGGFTHGFVKRVADSVANSNLPLTLVDVGGRTSVENEAICASATHAILLAGDWEGESWSQRLKEWREFCAKEGPVVIRGQDENGQEVVYEFYKQPQKIVAEIYSDYKGAEDTVQGVGEDGIFRGSIHYLERGHPTLEEVEEWLAERPCVVALAQFLVELVTHEEKN